MNGIEGEWVVQATNGGYVGSEEDRTFVLSNAGLVLNYLDVDTRKVASSSVNVSRLFYSVPICVYVEAFVTVQSEFL